MSWVFAATTVILGWVVIASFRAETAARVDFDKMGDIAHYWERRAKEYAPRGTVFVPPHSDWMPDA